MKVEFYPGCRKSAKGSAVCIGVFDGVHRGHQKILKAMKRDASKRKLMPTLLTFDPHPLTILKGKAPMAISSLAQRLAIAETEGVKKVFVLRFNKRFSEQAASVFAESFLASFVRARSIHVGKHFRYGKGGEGTVVSLKQALPQTVVQDAGLLDQNRRKVSSTDIRRLIAEGQLQKAAGLLGRPHWICGKHVKGLGLGKSLGAPTVNLTISDGLVPGSGVYYGLAGIRSLHPAAVHIGPTKTLKVDRFSVEIHYLDDYRFLQGRKHHVYIFGRLRDNLKFRSPEALSRQIALDIQNAKKNLKNIPKPLQNRLNQLQLSLRKYDKK